MPTEIAAGRQGSLEFLLPRLASLSNEEIQLISYRYLHIVEEYRDQQRHVTDKMPTNFVHLGLIARLFPHATVIQCQQNPMDIFVSNYCQHLSAAFCDLDQRVTHCEEHFRLMTHRRSMSLIPIHVVEYERMIADPESETRALVSHWGLHWDDACVAFHENKRAVHTPE
jgi:hypothetical protein